MNHCLHCGKETQNPKFCSRSCSAKESNKLHSKKSRENQRKSASITQLSKSIKNQFGVWQPIGKRPFNFKYDRTFEDSIAGCYTKVYKCICKYSGIMFYAPTKNKFIQI